MQVEICAIFDTKTQSYRAPFFCRTLGQAERWFESQLEHDEEIKKYPHDFNLMHLGVFDDDTGKLEPKTTGPAHVVTGLQLAASIAARPGN